MISLEWRSGGSLQSYLVFDSLIQDAATCAGESKRVERLVMGGGWGGGGSLAVAVGLHL